MVLPLIPVALIAVGALTGGSGVALGGKGAYDLRKAASQIKAAREQYDARYAETESRIDLTNSRLVALGDQQKQALTDVVVRMADFLRRIESMVRESERLIADGVDVDQSRVSGAQRATVDMFSWIGGAVGSATAASGASAAVSAAATSVGVASTGTAISGLSGAAATNATMAWLGGGALSAGGGGMAAGAAALNFVTIGPALLVGGTVVKGQGKKAITRAKEVQAQFTVGIAELGQTEMWLASVDTRVDELSSLLTQLRERAVTALDDLESEPFDPHVHAPRLQRAFQFVKAVSEVAAVPILDSEGGVTDRSAKMTVKYRAMAEGNERA